jgi:hypothetical protein
MTCVSCGPTNSGPSPQLQAMCTRCWWALPATTRLSYQSGRIGIKQIARASRDSQRSVRKFGGGGGRRVTVLVLGIVLMLANCAAPERRVADDVVRVDTGESEHAKELRKIVEEHSAEQYNPGDSIQPNVHPLTPEEFAATSRQAAKVSRGAVAENWQRRAEKAEAALARCRELCGQATDTTRPHGPPETHTVHFPNPATPESAPIGYPGPVRARALSALSAPSAPILDARQRPCIGYPIPKGLSVARVNVLLTPNLEAATIRLWSIPAWRELMRVKDGTFPVNMWRKRQGVATFIKQVRVQAGPELPTGSPQEALSPIDWRGGDVLCVEAVERNGPLWVVRDPLTGLIIEPRVSVVEMSSNDATAMPGQWTTVSGGAR